MSEQIKIIKTSGKPIALGLRSKNNRSALIVASTVIMICSLFFIYADSSDKTSDLLDNKNTTQSDFHEKSKIDTCFTPAEQCIDLIVNSIESAKTSIMVQAYGFTSSPIINALLQAKKRGVDVQVILDKSDTKSRNSQSVAKIISEAGIPVYIDYKPSIAHNKVIIIDRLLVMTGSYNFTASAESRNAENIIFAHSSETAVKYIDNWNSRKLVSRDYRTNEN